jgi:hypothetical protein
VAVAFEHAGVAAVAAAGVEVAPGGDIGHELGEQTLLPVRGERPRSR